MKLWQILLTMALGPLEAAGQAKVNEDENNTGADDLQGITMLWIAGAIRALIHNRPLPQLPAAVSRNATA